MAYQKIDHSNMTELHNIKTGRYRISVTSGKTENEENTNNAQLALESITSVVDEIDELLGIKKLVNKRGKSLILKRIDRMIALYNRRDAEAGIELAALGLFGKQLRDLKTRHIQAFRSLSKDILRQSHQRSWVGIRAEVSIAACLLEVIGIGFTKRERPDFDFDYQNKKLSIEVTSTHLTTDRGTNCVYKIKAKINSKNTMPYAKNDVALAIDITNIFHHYFSDTQGQEKNFTDELDRQLTGLEIKYGALILIIHSDNKLLNRYQMNSMTRVMSNCNSVLKSFIEEAFPKSSEVLADPVFLSES